VKKLFASLFVAGLLSSGLVGCGPTATTGGGGATPTTKAGGTTPDPKAAAQKALDAAKADWKKADEALKAKPEDADLKKALEETKKAVDKAQKALDEAK
jgi:hypothetical protein